jgi:hypothetical protein
LDKAAKDVTGADVARVLALPAAQKRFQAARDAYENMLKMKITPSKADQENLLNQYWSLQMRQELYSLIVPEEELPPPKPKK